MGNHRLNVKITLMGTDDEPAEINWWLNWSPDKAEDLYRELVRKAQEVGLEVEDKTYLFDE